MNEFCNLLCCFALVSGCGAAAASATAASFRHHNIAAEMRFNNAKQILSRAIHFVRQPGPRRWRVAARRQQRTQVRQFAIVTYSQHSETLAFKFVLCCAAVSPRQQVQRFVRLVLQLGFARHRVVFRFFVGVGVGANRQRRAFDARRSPFQRLSCRTVGRRRRRIAHRITNNNCI